MYQLSTIYNDNSRNRQTTVCFVIEHHFKIVLVCR